MRKHIVVDKERRVRFNRVEQSRQVWKSFYKNEFLPKESRILCGHLLSMNKEYFVQIRNFCIITGRSRGLVQDFSMSRICFKHYASNGLLEGVRKASW